MNDLKLANCFLKWEPDTMLHSTLSHQELSVWCCRSSVLFQHVAQSDEHWTQKGRNEWISQSILLLAIRFVPNDSLLLELEPGVKMI